MKIRTQIALAFLVFAILPMSVIVLVGYGSSRRAVREALEAEAAVLTVDMEQRMARVRNEITRRVERISELSFSEMMEGEGDQERQAFFASVMSTLGEAAPLVESFEFVPELPPAALAPPPPGRQPPDFRTPRPPAPIVIDMRAMHETVKEAIEHLPSDLLPEGMDKQTLLEQAQRGLATFDAEQAEEEAEAEAESEAQPPDDLEADLEDQLRLEAASDALAQGDAEGTSYRFTFEPRVEIPVYEEGAMVGELRALVKNEALLAHVLERTRRVRGEVPFALDAAGKLYSASEADSTVLDDLGVEAAIASGQLPSGGLVENWLFVISDTPAGGLTFGIARPIRDSLAEIRSTAIRNLGFGTGLIGLALLGVLPLSRRLTKGLGLVAEGADRIAAGDLGARVELDSRNEMGQLARAFNGMAADLEQNQRQLLEGERLRVEYERKTRELEEARRFQLSLLPRQLPEHPSFELAAIMKTATEVGGDYYDFRSGADGTLTIAIGDATGHGAKAGTMVTVVKSLFSAYPPEGDLADFQKSAAAAIKRMALGRMSMALSLLRLSGGRVSLSAAGMPPALIHRAESGRLEELALEGMPLGGLDYAYREISSEVASGDTLLLMSDGFPELLNPDGETLGYDRAAECFERAAGKAPEGIVETLLDQVAHWAGGQAIADDVTFVVVRIRRSP